MNRLILRRELRIFVPLVLLLCAIAGYGLFEGRRIIEGPRLSIETPYDGSATSSSRVLLSGEAQNISFLTINGLPAYVDESGHFSAALSPAPGYAIFTVAATDRFGRQVSREVHITVLNYCAVSTG
ncbi:hypothetical protein H7X87_02765 [Acetobacteraceae bacterium]|nr:hypothetical protein [Candidatus Parcubacteria bacterium]